MLCIPGFGEVVLALPTGRIWNGYEWPVIQIKLASLGVDRFCPCDMSVKILRADYRFHIYPNILPFR